MRLTVCLLYASLALCSLAACGEIGRAGGGGSAETDAVRMYSERAKALEHSEGELQKAWQELSETKTLELFARRLRAGVIPKLRGHISRLSAIKPALPDLHGAHRALVEAYAQLERELQALADRAEKATPEQVKKELDEALARARSAELTYRQDIDIVFARHGFKVAKRGGPADSAAKAAK